MGSDSGRIVVLQFNPDKNVFDKVHQETFGKTGCRRIVPGQYIATDPKGRAILIGACGAEQRAPTADVCVVSVQGPLRSRSWYT